jgi:hypothetical protein
MPPNGPSGSGLPISGTGCVSERSHANFGIRVCEGHRDSLLGYGFWALIPVG